MFHAPVKNTGNNDSDKVQNLPLLVTSDYDNINQLIDGFQLLQLGAEAAVKLRLSGILTVL